MSAPVSASASVVTPPRWRRRLTLAEGLNGHRNSLGIIRLVLASAVIFSHAFYLGGWGHDPFLDLVRQQESIGGIAVIGFFAVSGYLIAKSGSRGDVVRFMWHRALRILPAYWVVLVIGAFGVGSVAWLVSGRGLGGYLTAIGPGGPWSYVYSNIDLAIRQYGVLDVFVDTPYGATAGSVLNGSLWTLAYEWFCYLVIAVLVLGGVLARPRLARVAIPLLVLLLLTIQVVSTLTGVNLGTWIPFLADPLRSRLLYAFAIGSLFAVLSHRIRLDWRLAALAAVVLVASLAAGGFAIVGLPAIAYLVMWTAAALPESLQWIGARNDYSYGMYVYGWLIQQCLAAVGVHEWGYVPYVLLTLVITAGCAWLSWHGVEKRALAIKDRGPGRGVRFWWDRIRIRDRGAAQPSA